MNGRKKEVAERDGDGSNHSRGCVLEIAHKLVNFKREMIEETMVSRTKGTKSQSQRRIVRIPEMVADSDFSALTSTRLEEYVIEQEPKTQEQQVLSWLKLVKMEKETWNGAEVRSSCPQQITQSLRWLPCLAHLWNLRFEPKKFTQQYGQHYY